jgi:hypothetical protein
VSTSPDPAATPAAAGTNASADQVTIVFPPSVAARQRGLIVLAVLTGISFALGVFAFQVVGLALGTGLPPGAVIGGTMLFIIGPMGIASLASQGLLRPLFTGLATHTFRVTPDRLEVATSFGWPRRRSWPRAAVADVVVHLVGEERGNGVYELRIHLSGQRRPIALLCGATDAELSQLASELRHAVGHPSRDQRARDWLLSTDECAAAPAASSTAAPGILSYATQPEDIIWDRPPGRLRLFIPPPQRRVTLREAGWSLAFLLVFLLVITLPGTFRRGRLSPAPMLWAVVAAVVGTALYAAARTRAITIEVSVSGLLLTTRGLFRTRTLRWQLSDVREVSIDPFAPSMVRLCLAGGRILTLPPLQSAAQANALVAKLRPALGFAPEVSDEAGA